MATKKKTTTKTKPFRQNSKTGKIASKKEVEENPTGTVTQTVPQDGDGVRSDKGGTHKRAIIQDRPTDIDQTGEVTGEISAEQASEILDNTKGTPFDQTDTGSMPVATGEAVETDIPDAAEPETKNDEPALPCLFDRFNKPTGYDCLAEMKEAIEHPERFTQPQYDAIINETNLCANCKKRQDAGD